MANTLPTAADPGHADELALAERAATGDRDAQREVVLSLMDRVRNTVTYLVGRSADADDLAQIALMEVLRSLHTYSGRGGLGAWSNRIVVRCVYAQLRRGATRRARDAEAVVEASVGAGGADLSTRLVGDRRRRRIAELLQEISEHKRMTLVLKLVHGYSVQEISELTEVPFETVRSRLRHGRKELMDKVREDPELASAVEAWK